MESNTIDTLNDLIEASKDGEYGFSALAENSQNPQLRDLFVRRSRECAEAASELQHEVVRLGGDAEDGGSVTGAVHRGWVGVKATLSGHSDLAILEEAERGEDSALDCYRTALQDELPQSARMVVERQNEGVKRNHAHVRALRDQARAAKN